MAKMYAVSKTYHIGFWIKADNEDDVWDWLRDHACDDVRYETGKYEEEWDEDISDEFDYPEDFSFTLDEGEYVDLTDEDE